MLAADTYAKSISGGLYNTAYTDALWLRSEGFTISLFQRASNALASLIYTAWIQAGSPSMVLTELNPATTLNSKLVLQNMPNPFIVSSHISYTVSEYSNVSLEVRDINGKMISTLVNETLPEGHYFCDWTPENLQAGMYFIVLKSGNNIQVRKMVYSGGM